MTGAKVGIISALAILSSLHIKKQDENGSSTTIFSSKLLALRTALCQACRKQEGLDSAVGNTPLIYMETLSRATGCHIFAKAEFMNPTGSVKGR